MMKSLFRLLRFALIGWVAGAISTLVIGLLWPSIFPGIVNPDHYFKGNSLTLFNIMAMSLTVASLPALIGGLMGGSLPREGGSRDQTIAAAIGGILLSIPFNCFNYWMLSGA